LELEKDSERFEPRDFHPSSQYCASPWNMNVGRYYEITILPPVRIFGNTSKHETKKKTKYQIRRQENKEKEDTGFGVGTRATLW